MITVYGDILFAVNFFMDFLLLKVTSLICKRVRTWRLCAGALLGAVYATTVFFLNMPFVLSLCLNALCGGIMTAVTFSPKSKKALVKQTGIFYGVSFLACGIILPIFLTGNAFISNGSVYFSAGIRRLMLGAAAVYGAVRIICHILDSIALSRGCEVNIKISVKDKAVSAVALVDTGNSLTEPFTGLPVCILQRNKYEQLCSGNEKLYIIPYKTVSGDKRVMTGICPDSVTVTDISGKQYFPECIVAVTDIHIKKGMEAIINPCMLTGVKNQNEKSNRAEKLYNIPSQKPLER